MEYTFETTKWWYINDTTYGKLDAGLHLKTSNDPIFFDSKEEIIAYFEDNNIDFDEDLI